MSFRLRIEALASLATVLAATGFAASSANAQAGPASSESALEEIIVTARRREENLQHTPMSISAFTGESLKRRHIDALDSIAALTPNLIFDAGGTISGTSSAASAYIRGIGQIDFALTTEPGVGIYLDGVYLSQSIGGVLDLLDVERIEVLRGPQGTLFGRNTIGGAISVTSKMPDDTLHGDIEVTSGEYSRIDLRGSVNFPLTDTLFARVSGGTFSRDGFVNAPNTPSGEDLGDTDQQVGRIALRFVPNDNFEALLTADYTREREQGAPSVLIGTFEGVSLGLIDFLSDPASPGFVPPPGPLPPPSFIDLHNILATVPLGEQGCLPPGPMTPPFCPPGIVPNPLFGQQTMTQADVIDIQKDKLVNLSNLDLGTETDVWGVSLTLAYDFDRVTLKSISSFRHMDARTGRDQDALPIVQGQQISDFDVDQLSQEFQLSGLAMNDRLNWLLGFYYFTEDGTHLDDVEFTAVRILSGAKIDNESTAGFGQVTFDISDKLAITGGLRFTDETKKFIVPDTCFPLPNGPETLFDGTVVTCAQLQTVIDPKFLNTGFLSFVNFPLFPDDLPNPDARLCCLPISDADGNVVNLVRGLTAGDEVIPRGTTKRSFDDWTPHLNLAYQWTNDLMTYVSYSEGFKSGGFSQRIFPPKTEVPSFSPETAKVYEFGFKWSGLAGRVRVNASIFHTDYEDLQIQINDGIAPVTRNAAEADIDGFELEITALPADGWLIQGGVGYLDAEYTKLDPNEDFTTDIRSITLDSELPNVPEWSTNLAVQYTWWLPQRAQLIPRIDWAYRSEVFNGALNFDELRQGSYSLVDAGITLVSPGDNWQASIFVRNLTDEEYIVSGFANALTQGQVDAIVGRPREWGVSVLYRFGN